VVIKKGREKEEGEREEGEEGREMERGGREF
jgi:hypothetical protein